MPTRSRSATPDPRTPRASASTAVWPTGFSQGALSPWQGSCAPVGAGPDFSCALGTIRAGASATVTAATRARLDPRRHPDDDGQRRQCGQRPRPGQRQRQRRTDCLELPPSSSRRTTGWPRSSPARPVHAYTITVTNSGPSDADGVIVADTVPGAFTVGSPRPISAGLLGSIGNTIQCTLPASLGVGATWTIVLPYAVAATVSPQIVVNTAAARQPREPRRRIRERRHRRDRQPPISALTVTDGLARSWPATGSPPVHDQVTNAGPSDATRSV